MTRLFCKRNDFCNYPLQRQYNSKQVPGQNTPTHVENKSNVYDLRNVENYLGHFLEKLQKISKKYKKLPTKEAREARPFVDEANFCTCSIFFAIIPKI